MNREEILDRYRHLRAICIHHQNTGLDFVSRQVIQKHAKRLGLLEGRMLVAEHEREMTLVLDLALYTAKEGRSRALDRYARAAQLPSGSDEALVLDAMRHARFSIWRIERRHETAGLVVADLLRDTQEWLMDERLEVTAAEGMGFAGRLCEPEDFAMICGAIVPADRDLIEEVTLDAHAWRRGEPGQVAQDPRFATALYRTAIASGVMARVVYEPSSGSRTTAENGQS